jgi:hypothetical protein
MFASKAGLHSTGRLLALSGNIILTMVKAPAYCTISVVFVTIRNSRPSLIFMSKAGLHLTAMYLALPGGIRLGWKQLSMTNTPAYCTISIVYYKELPP